MRTFILVCCAALSAGMVNDAHAYIDPFVGSYLFQVIIAGLMALLFALSRFRQTIAGLFERVTRVLNGRPRIEDTAVPGVFPPAGETAPTTDRDESRKSQA